MNYCDSQRGAAELITYITHGRQECRVVKSKTYTGKFRYNLSAKILERIYFSFNETCTTVFYWQIDKDKGINEINFWICNKTLTISMYEYSTLNHFRTSAHMDMITLSITSVVLMFSLSGSCSPLVCQ